MNFKTLLIIIIVLILFNLGFFYFKSNQNKTSPLLPNSQTASNTISVPLDPNNPQLKSSTLVYAFYGGLKEVKVLNNNTYQLFLDNSDSKSPAFIVTDFTPIFKEGDENLNQVKIDSIKLGITLTIGMSYDLKTKSWTLNTITITDWVLTPPCYSFLIELWSGFSCFYLFYFFPFFFCFFFPRKLQKPTPPVQPDKGAMQFPAAPLAQRLPVDNKLLA